MCVESHITGSSDRGTHDIHDTEGETSFLLHHLETLANISRLSRLGHEDIECRLRWEKSLVEKFIAHTDLTRNMCNLPEPTRANHSCIITRPRCNDLDPIDIHISEGIECLIGDRLGLEVDPSLQRIHEDARNLVDFFLRISAKFSHMRRLKI